MRENWKYMSRYMKKEDDSSLTADKEMAHRGGQV